MTVLTISYYSIDHPYMISYSTMCSYRFRHLRIFSENRLSPVELRGHTQALGVRFDAPAYAYGARAARPLTADIKEYETSVTHIV